MAARQARDLTRRKSLLESAPACPASSPTARRSNPSEAELFIVEGDSRRRLAPSRRATREYQAILPIRGKILNVERARIDKMLKNDEIQALITAIGAGVGEEFDVDEAPLPQGSS